MLWMGGKHDLARSLGRGNNEACQIGLSVLNVERHIALPAAELKRARMSLLYYTGNKTITLPRTSHTSTIIILLILILDRYSYLC